MAKPLQGGIAKLVAKGMKAAKLALPATLVKITPGTRTPGAVTGGTNPTKTSYTASGFVDDFLNSEIDGTLVVTGDRKIMLYGATIAGGAVPTSNDEVTINGATYRIRSVGSDPANAVYVCAAYGATVT